MMRRIIALFLLVSGVACGPLVPARTPPQLAHTPGPFIRFEGSSVVTDGWAVDYPRGWRIVRMSIASAPIQIVFVSPDDRLIITVGEAPLPEVEPITVGEALVYLGGTAPPDDAATLAEVLTIMRESLRPVVPR